MYDLWTQSSRQRADGVGSTAELVQGLLLPLALGASSGAELLISLSWNFP
jgi:hypothetical protein